jgi:ribonuclease BN (tRNA processing enzyme)
LHEVYSETEPNQDWPEYLCQFHTSTAQLAEMANQAKPKLLVLYHQIWGNVLSAKDLDVY